jgi:hypothetical protein
MGSLFIAAQDPPLIRCGHAVGRVFQQSTRYEMCTGTRFFSPQTHTFSGLPSFAKSCPESSERPRNLRRSAWRATGGGSVGSLPWVDQCGCREFQSALEQAAKP